jgi:hypothetical protein
LARSLAFSSVMLLKKTSAGISATLRKPSGSLELKCGFGRYRQRNARDGLRTGSLPCSRGVDAVVGWLRRRGLRRRGGARKYEAG